MEKTAKIALRYPAQLSDRTLSSITMRRPTVGDMLDYPIKNGGLDEEAALVATLTGLRPEDLRELDMEDYEPAPHVSGPEKTRTGHWRKGCGCWW